MLLQGCCHIYCSMMIIVCHKNVFKFAAKCSASGGERIGGGARQAMRTVGKVRFHCFGADKSLK